MRSLTICGGCVLAVLASFAVADEPPAKEEFKRVPWADLKPLAGSWKMTVDARSGWKGWLQMNITLVKEDPRGKRAEDGAIQFDFDLSKGKEYAKVTNTFAVFFQVAQKGDAVYLVNVGRAAFDRTLPVKVGGPEDVRLEYKLAGDKLSFDASKSHKSFFTQGLVERELPWNKMEWTRVQVKK